MHDRRPGRAADRQDGEFLVPERGQVADDGQRAASAVDLDRVDVGSCVAFQDDEGQPPPLRRGHEVDVDGVAEDEAVDQRLADACHARVVRAVDKAERGARRVAGKGRAEQKFASIGAADHFGHGIGAGWHEADGVEPAFLEQPALWIGAAIAERARRRFDALAQFGPDQLRPVEDVGDGAARNAGGAGRHHRAWWHRQPVISCLLRTILGALQEFC